MCKGVKETVDVGVVTNGAVNRQAFIQWLSRMPKCVNPYPANVEKMVSSY